MPIEFILLGLTALYSWVACVIEDRSPPPGRRVVTHDRALHLCVLESVTKPIDPVSIVLDHSLGGMEGYLIAEQLLQSESQSESNHELHGEVHRKFQCGRVCFYDRAGYGWSDHSSDSRTSDHIVTELNALLIQANIQPPYLLVGDSFGSYNMRLYADRYPEQVVGLVLTDGLHESGMLAMSIAVQALKLLFISGFVMATIGSALGIVRVLKDLGVFELLKPELRSCPPDSLRAVKRSFCRPKHWITMARELWSLDESGRQMPALSPLNSLPIVNIKSASFFKPALWTAIIPLKAVNQLRDRMHEQLAKLSTNTVQIKASKSGHFVWIDEPFLITQVITQILIQASPQPDRTPDRTPDRKNPIQNSNPSVS